MKNIIVSFANRTKRYVDAANVQRATLEYQNYNGTYVCYGSEHELGCPSHEEVPYAFKAYAIKKAYEAGYDNILWLDSVVQAVQPLDKLFDHIAETGFAFFDNYTYKVGDFCNQSCRDIMQVTDAELSAPMIMACVMGLNRDKAKEFINGYFEGANNGSFVGGWEDHRHDQTVASILINRQNLPILQGHETFFMYYFMTGKEFTYNDKAITLTKGQDVCLMSI